MFNCGQAEIFHWNRRVLDFRVQRKVVQQFLDFVFIDWLLLPRSDDFFCFEKALRELFLGFRAAAENGF